MTLSEHRRLLVRRRQRLDRELSGGGQRADKYIGIDVHARSCTLAVIDGVGKRVGQHVIETNGESLVECLRMIPGPRHLCIEEGTQSAWLYEILSPHVQELAVVNVTDSRGPKSDERDAFALAEKFRLGALDKRVLKNLGPYRKLRELGRAHLMVVRDVVRTQNRIKSLLRSRGVPVEGKAVYGAEGRGPYLDKLPDGTRAAASTLFAQYDALQEIRKRAEKELLAEARLQPITAVLGTCPGIGPIRAAQLVPIVATPHRFRTKRQFWSYCGLGILMRSSSDWGAGRFGQLAAGQGATDPRSQFQSQPSAQGHLQGAGHHDSHAVARRPAVPRLPAPARRRNETKPGEGHRGPKDRGDRARDVEDRGGLRPRQTPQADFTITRRGCYWLSRRTSTRFSSTYATTTKVRG